MLFSFQAVLEKSLADFPQLLHFLDLLITLGDALHKSWLLPGLLNDLLLLCLLI